MRRSAAAGGDAVAGMAAYFRPGLPSGLEPEAYEAAMQIVEYFVIVHVLLGVFNLLPIPPLDGSRMADALVPAPLQPLWNPFFAIGPLVLIAVILLPFFVGFSIWSRSLAWTSELLLRLGG